MVLEQVTDMGRVAGCADGGNGSDLGDHRGGNNNGGPAQTVANQEFGSLEIVCQVFCSIDDICYVSAEGGL